MSGLPVLNAKGESIPEAWENSILKLYEKGQWYKRDDPDDNKLQVDSTMMITIENPDSELFAHKWIGCGIENLLEYEMEMLGAKDNWKKNPNDPDDKRWDYLYHQRLATYPSSKGPIDQIKFAIKRLSERPFSRRTNMITWVPEEDTINKDTPCLQRIEFLITPDQKNSETQRLNMTYNFRSRNVMTAAPMNMIGLYALQCTIRDAVKEKIEMNLKNGRMVDFTDSYHVSTRDQKILKGFMERYNTSISKGETIQDRTYTKQFTFKYMNSVLPEITEKIITQTKKYLSGQALENEIKKIKQIAESRKR